ncbi:MAG: protein kinase [Planctomycetota bacterium]
MASARDDLPALDGADATLSSLLDQDPAARRAQLAALRESDPAQADQLGGMLAALDEFGLLGEPAAAPALPDRIGPFRILSVLGQGGMGTVYLAERDGLARRVALKVIHGAMAQSPRLRERFRREAAAASRLEHPAICPVYEVGETDGTPWIAMRFVAGTSLGKRIDQAQANGAPMPRDVAVRLVTALADGVHRAHEAGLVHRDIKPGNVLLDSDGNPVLVDFGLASLDDQDGERLTRSGDSVGTPHYMAPEQIGGGAVDRRCDVYALGVVLYECLTLRTPFDAVNRESLFRQILRDEPEDPRRLNRRLDRDTGTVLQVALAKDPERRYRTAAMFADDLRRLLANQPILARRAGPLLRLRRFAQRNPLAATFVGFLLAGLAAFAELLRRNTDLLDRAEANEQALRSNEAGVLSPIRGLARAMAAVRQDGNLDTISAQYQAVQRHRVAAVLRHDALVWSARFSPQGDRILTCGEDHTARLWERDGRPVVALPHEANVQWAEWSPNGDCFATGSQAGRARIFERDGRLRHRLDHGWPERPGNALLDLGAGRWVSRVRFSPDGRQLATNCSDGKLRVWDVATGQLQHMWIGAERFIEFMWSPDGRTVAAFETVNDQATDRTPFRVLFWHVGQRMATPVLTLVQESSINEIEFSPDGTNLLTCARDGTVRMFEVASGRESLRLAHVGNVQVAHFSADGRQILTSGADHVVRLWEHDGRAGRVRREVRFALHPRAHFLRDGRIVVTYMGSGVAVLDRDMNHQHTFRGHSDLVYHAPDLSPDGTQLVSASWDATAVVWQMFDPELPRIPAHHHLVTAMANLPDGKVVSVGEDRRLCITDLATGACESQEIPLAPTGVMVSSDPSRVVVAHNGFHGGAEASVIDLRPGRRVTSLPIGGLDVAAALLPGDRLVTVAARGTGDSQALVCSLDRMDSRAWGRPVSGPGFHLAYSGVRDQVAVAGFHLRIHVRSASGDEVGWWRAHEGRVFALAFEATGHRLASASRDGEARLWDLQRWVAGPASEPPPCVRLVGHEGRVHAVAWSSDGRRVATAGIDGTVRLWDAATGQPEAVLRPDSGATGCVLFTADNRFLLTGGLDGAIESWPTERSRLADLAERATRRSQPSVSPPASTVHMFAATLVAGNRELAARLGREVMERGIAEKDELLLDEMAWRIVARPAGKSPAADLGLALQAAEAAVRLANGRFWGGLETLAETFFLRGDVAAAVETMRKAVALCDHENLRRRLGDYEAALARTK